MSQLWSQKVSGVELRTHHSGEGSFYVGENGMGSNLAQVMDMTRHSKGVLRDLMFAAWGVPNLDDESQAIRRKDAELTGNFVKKAISFKLYVDPAGQPVPDVSQNYISAEILAQPMTIEQLTDEDTKAFCISSVIKLSGDSGVAINAHLFLNEHARVTIRLPWVDDSLALTNTAPVFKRSFQSVAAWLAPYNAINSSQANDEPRWKSAIRAFVACTHRYILSNGGLYGQIARVKNTNTIGEGLRTLHPEASRVGSQGAWDQYVSDVKTSWFIHGDTMTLGDLYTQLFTRSVGDEWLKINKTATCGPGYPTTDTRKQTFTSDIFVANSTLGRLSNLDLDVEKGLITRDTAHTAMRPILEWYEAVMKVWVKPKFEVMLREKLFTKVRNIYVFPSFAQVLIGKFCSIFNAYNNEVLGNSGYSLKGFNPMYSQLDRIIKEIMTKQWAFYSDNVYYYSKATKTLYSLDVEKMESTSTPQEGALAVTMMLSAFGLDQETCLGRFLIATGGVYANDRTGALGDYSGTVIGLMSGSQTTFLINHFRMACATTRLRAHQDELEKLLETTPSGSGIKIPREWGIYFYLERTCSTADPKSENACISCESSRYVNIEMAYQSPGTIYKMGPIVHLDMLGFDGTTVTFPEENFGDQNGQTVMLACLDYERLMKAITYRKPGKRQKPTQDKKTQQVQTMVVLVVEIMTLRTLYITGGYAYQEASDLLITTASLQRTNLLLEYQGLCSLLGIDSLTGSAEGRAILENILSMAIEADENAVTVDDGVHPVDPAESAREILMMLEDAQKFEVFFQRFMDRANVIRAFHSNIGKAERDAARKKKLEELEKRKGKKGSRFLTLFGEDTGAFTLTEGTNTRPWARKRPREENADNREVLRPAPWGNSETLGEPSPESPTADGTESSGQATHKVATITTNRIEF